jgi:hypothetical protein
MPQSLADLPVRVEPPSLRTGSWLTTMAEEMGRAAARHADQMVIDALSTMPDTVASHELMTAIQRRLLTPREPEPSYGIGELDRLDTQYRQVRDIAFPQQDPMRRLEEAIARYRPDMIGEPMTAQSVYDATGITVNDGDLITVQNVTDIETALRTRASTYSASTYDVEFVLNDISSVEYREPKKKPKAKITSFTITRAGTKNVWEWLREPAV